MPRSLREQFWTASGSLKVPGFRKVLGSLKVPYSSLHGAQRIIDENIWKSQHESVIIANHNCMVERSLPDNI